MSSTKKRKFFMELILNDRKKNDNLSSEYKKFKQQKGCI